MIHLKTLWKYEGLLGKCFLEPLRHGFSLFDTNGQFIGAIYDQGFALDREYAHADEVNIEMTKKGIKVFDYRTFEEVKNETELAEALYGDPT